MGNYIWGIDVETDGLDVTTTHVLEVGAVLYDYDNRKPVKIYNQLVNNDGVTAVPEEITKITGITQEYIDLFGIGAGAVASDIFFMLRQYPVIMAHNGERFDKPVVLRMLAEAGLTVADLNVVWVDSAYDIEYPPEFGPSRKLKHLAADYGFLHDDSAHRAVFDVMAMLRIASHFDIGALIEGCKSPMITIQALVNFNTKDLAKARGYHWDGRLWTKQIRENKLPLEKEGAEFGILKVA
jgi:DNA polymerase III epsilon subunit-like protein